MAILRLVNAMMEADVTAAARSARILLILIAAGCASASREVATTYAPQLGVDLQRMTRNPSGLYWNDLIPGTGTEATAGRTVRVLFIGWLPDGTRFDASETAPFEFALGGGVVIPGWDEGITGMKVGGTRRLVIPPYMGYGTQARAGRIPANSTLVFDIQLVEVR
jgi:FKBP-type peptidyl-prolyl cis-trans isomerase